MKVSTLVLKILLEWLCVVTRSPGRGLKMAEMPLRPLTRVRYSAAAVERAEKALHRARLEHAKTIRAARKAGNSFAQIGQALGVSPQRVHAFLKWAEGERRE